MALTRNENWWDRPTNSVHCLCVCQRVWEKSEREGERIVWFARLFCWQTHCELPHFEYHLEIAHHRLIRNTHIAWSRLTELSMNEVERIIYEWKQKVLFIVWRWEKCVIGKIQLKLDSIESDGQRCTVCSLCAPFDTHTLHMIGSIPLNTYSIEKVRMNRS